MANDLQQNNRSLLVGQILAGGAGGSAVGGSLAQQLATNQVTAAANATLHFAAVPAAIVNGMVIEDLTGAGLIPAGTTVVSTTSTTVVMSQAATGAGVGSGDVIRFSMPVQAWPMTSGTLARQMCGQGSQLALMVDHYRKADGFGELWILPLLDDPNAVAASGTITINAAATAAGTIPLYVDGVSVPVGVTTAMTANQIASAVAAAVNAINDLPVTAVAVGAVVTLTAKQKGLAGNDIDFRLAYYGAQNGEAVPAGMQIALATPTGAASGAATLSGGTTNPTTALTAALAVLGDKQFDFVGQPYGDAGSLNAFRDWLGDAAGRWNWAHEDYGGAFGAYRATIGGLQSFGVTRNDQHMAIIGYYDSPNSPAAWAAELTGACAVSLAADPALPLHDLQMPGLLPPPSVTRFLISDRNTLLWDGISTFKVDQGGLVMTEKVITTYQLNTFGMPDDSYLNVETLFTLSYILRYLKTRITTKFARKKLADDGTRISNNTVTPAIVRSEIVAAYGDLEEIGLVQDTALFAKTIDVERNPTNRNRLDVLWPGTLIDQLDVVALLAQFRR